MSYITTPGTSGWGPVADGNVYGANLAQQNFDNSGWGQAFNLASSFLGGLGGGSKGGSSSNVDKGGYLQQAKKEARKDQSMKKVFDNFSIYEPSWEPQSNPQQFAQQYAASGGGSSGGGGGNKAMSVLGGAATGAQLGSIIPGVGTVVGAIGGGLAGLFCDVRLKTDIAPLERSDVHDELAEMAFLVKEIRECA